MPIIEPDLSQVSSGVIEPGSKPSKITSADTGTSAAGNPKVIVKLDVDDNGKIFKRQSHLVTSGPGAFTFSSLLRATGFGDIADRMEKGERIPFDTDKLVGQEVFAVVEADTYNNAPSDKITGFLPK